MEKAKNDDERKRQDLLKFYTEFNDFLVTLDENLFNPLQKHVGNVQENMTNHTDQLKYWSRDQQKEKGYFLLVAGRVVKSKVIKRHFTLTKESNFTATETTVCA